VMMDVIANNISNVNTVGYKASRVSFEDIMSQTMRGAAAGTTTLGSINPAQVGLGMTVAGIDILQTQGNRQTTGKVTDMAIDGDGFFIMANGSQQFYTRDGAFDTDTSGSLVNPSNGLKVMGWQADAKGNIDSTQAATAITIPIGQRTTAQASSSGSLRGNLNASAAVGDTSSTTMTIYDSLGVAHSILLTFAKTAANAWSWTASADPADTSCTTTSTGTLTFSSDGIMTAATGTLSVAFDATTSGANSPIDMVGDWTRSTPPAADPPLAKLDFSTVTQFSGDSEVTATADGFTSGTLTGFSVGGGGVITGVYTNGQTLTLGQLALANFLNPSGLIRAGQSLFTATAASGNAVVGTPGSGGRGNVVTSALEMSNVDLAEQFTGMITAQRGFQANSRVITASDEMLQDLVNMKR
jgi:flagellar hook protein FlgE